MPTLHKFKNLPAPGPQGEKAWENTSVVMSPEEFEDFCDAISALDLTLPVDVSALRREKHIRLMYRGSKTATLFDRVGADTPYMTVIVRGEGENVVKRMLNEKRN